MSEFFVNPELFCGRPPQKRSDKEEDCYDLLEKLGIPFMRADHDPADTVEDCKAVEQVVGVHICKNLFLCNRQRTNFYLLMMPGDKPFSTRDFSRLLGISRVSFASAQDMLRLIGLTPGSVSIMGLMYDKDIEVQLCIDSQVISGEYIRCHPNLNTSTLKIKTQDVRTKLLPYLRHKPLVLELPVHSGDEEKND